MNGSIQKICKTILGELDSVLCEIDNDSAKKMIEMILSARRIFLTGEGRSGLVARAFAMRLMLLGLDSYFVGEMVTPSTGSDDLLIACSGSGETGTTCYIVETAKRVRAKVCGLTSNMESKLAKLSDLTVVVRGTPKVRVKGIPSSIQLGGTLFEQSLLLFLDAMIVCLRDRLRQSEDDMLRRHTNLL